MISHRYPRNHTTNGVGRYGQLIDPLLQTITEEAPVYHVELGYGEHELLWQTYRHMRHHQSDRLVITLHDPPIVVGKPCAQFLPQTNYAIKVLRKLLDYTVGRWVVHWVVRRANALVVLNPASIPSVVQRFGVSADKLHTSHLPSLIKVQATPVPAPRKTEGLHLLYFGNISPRKGLPLLLRALENLSTDMQVQLDIVGGSTDTRYTQSLMGDVQGLPPSVQATIHGYLNDDELRSLLQASHMVVLPYFDEEVIHASGPLSIAMQAGRGVLCSDIATFSEVVHGETGLVFPEGDESALAQRLQELIHNPRLAGKLGAAAAKWAASHLSMTVVKQDLQKVYEAL